MGALFQCTLIDTIRLEGLQLLHGVIGRDDENARKDLSVISDEVFRGWYK